MEIRRRVRPSVALVATWLAMPAAAQTMYGIGEVLTPFDGLMTIDLATAATMFVDPTQSYEVMNTGVAIACDGRFFGFNRLTAQTGELYEVDLATAAFSVFQSFVVAATSPAMTSGIGFAFAADGQPYVVNDARLYRLDTARNELVYVGDTGYSSHADLALGLDCTLQSSGLAAGVWDYVSIDEQTGAATVLGVSVPGSMISVEPANGRLYGTQNFNLLELDPSTGALLNTVGSMGRSCPGMAFEVPSSCYNRPVAAIAPPAAICVGERLQLDGSASTACGDPGLEYRWRRELTVLCDWSPLDFCDVAPAITADHQLDVRCVNAPGMCPSTADATVVVVTPPTAIAGPDLSVCELTPITLDGSRSTGAWCADLEYEWWEGATRRSGPGPDPTFAPSTATTGTTTYTLIVRCTGPAPCESTDDVVVTVRACPLEVIFESVSARIVDKAVGRVTVSWRTAMEEGSLGFSVERAAAADGPWSPVGGAPARGAGTEYTIDDLVRAGARPWYRVVELTLAGRFTESPPVRATTPASGSRRRGW